MKKFITKISIIFLLVIVPNLTIGILRVIKKDKITYAVHEMLRTPKKQLDTTFAIEEMSRDTLGLIVRKTDKYGNSNSVVNKKPKILFIGDSFFHDPLISSDSGLQALTNSYFGQNVCYNIGQPRRAGFKFYNYLLSEHAIEEPKVIICEVVQRHLFEAWSKIKETISDDEKADLGNKHYYYMDLIFGNNFKNITKSKLFTDKPEKPEVWHSSVVDSQRVFFYRNELEKLDDNNVKILSKNLLYAQNYFSSKGIMIYFVIVPDKESLYPEVYGRSSLPEIQQKLMDQHINMIDVYSFISNDRHKYFHAGDSHWTLDAIKVFSKMVDDKIPTSVVAHPQKST